MSQAKLRVLLSWSTGKDAAWSLHALRATGEFDAAALITSVNRESGRVAMHSTRQELLERQAEAVGLPLVTVPLPWPCSNEDYEAAMRAALTAAGHRFSADYVAFGDLFLEDVRGYRERLLEPTGLRPLFPLWGRPTRGLAEEMIDGGLRAYVTCVDSGRLPASFAGRTFDHELLAELPPAIDPCGEQGEFHTFAIDGPMFSAPVRTELGEVTERDGFVFADLICAADPPAPAESIFDRDGALTRAFLLDRGYCCGNRCRNCPYDWEAVER
jgi:uncharacterized protein (TIGR00290 family)